MTDVSAAAAALVAARKECRVMDELPGGMPQNMDEAYAIQDGIVTGMGDAVAGWKVAFTNKPGQEKMGDYRDDDIKAVIGSVHPAIEIVNRRLSGAVPMSGLAIIVDHGGNGAFAYGAGTEDWESIDYANHPVRQIINGEEKAVGTGQNVMGGNPVGSITWLANHLKTRGHSLKAGDWVSSGSAAEMLPVPAGGTVKGDFGSLGTVEVSFS